MHISEHRSNTFGVDTFSATKLKVEHMGFFEVRDSARSISVSTFSTACIVCSTEVLDHVSHFFVAIFGEDRQSCFELAFVKGYLCLRFSRAFTFDTLLSSTNRVHSFGEFGLLLFEHSELFAVLLFQGDETKFCQLSSLDG